jgi:hypothetical protein
MMLDETARLESKTLVWSVGLVLISLLMVAESFAGSASELTRTASGGGVTVKATYLNPQSADDVRFEIALDTHSVNLDAYDLKDLSLLHDASGNTYKPLRREQRKRPSPPDSPGVSEASG